MENIQTNSTHIKKYKIYIIFLVPILFLLFSVFIYFHNIRYVSTDDAYVKISTIDVSSQINGVVNKVNVDNNQFIKKDSVIFEIEKKPYLIEYESAKASLDIIKNQIKSLQSSYRTQISAVKFSEANFIYQEKQYKRAIELYNANLISRSELDNSYRGFSSSMISLEGSIELAQKKLNDLNGNINASIEQYPEYIKAQSILDLAKFNLDNTEIKATSDGFISNLYLKSGMYVNIGRPLFSIIDSNEIWVEANFKETQLRNFKPGQKADIEIDTYPNYKIEAVIDSITRASGSEFSILPSQNTSGNWVKVTQRIMVKLKLINIPNLIISSGMSVNVTIDTKS